MWSQTTVSRLISFWTRFLRVEISKPRKYDVEMNSFRLIGFVQIR